MVPNTMRRRSTFMLAALNLLNMQAGVAVAKPLVVDGSSRLSPTGWSLQDERQLAVVGADNDEPGVFAGFQCDPLNGHSHRLIFGALRSAQSADKQIVAQIQTERLIITTAAPSMSAKFEIYPEDRGQTSFGGGANYAAAYLNQQQFNAINSASDFVVMAGTHRYRFSGSGSGRTIGAMACQSMERHAAKRLIARRSEDASQQELGAWQVALYSGTAALPRARAEAFASTTNHPANTAARFTLGLSCSDRRIYAHVDVGINPDAREQADMTSINAFMHDFDQSDKLIEVYRAGQRLATFVIGSDGVGHRGHGLSTQELASLKSADALAVVGEHKVIEFSTANVAESLQILSQSCGRSI